MGVAAGSGNCDAVAFKCRSFLRALTDLGCLDCFGYSLIKPSFTLNDALLTFNLSSCHSKLSSSSGFSVPKNLISHVSLTLSLAANASFCSNWAKFNVYTLQGGPVRLRGLLNTVVGTLH